MRNRITGLHADDVKSSRNGHSSLIWRSREAETAVDGDNLARYPFGSWVGERHDPPRHIEWLSSPLERYTFTLLRFDRRSLLLREPHHSRQCPGISRPRRDRIDSHTPRSKFQG